MTSPATGVIYTDTVTNYVGELLPKGNNSLPFLNMIGGLSRVRPINSTEFPMSQTWSVDAGSQPSISEASAVTATKKYVPRAQEFNVVEIFQEGWEVTYSKLGESGQVGGISILGSNPVEDERSVQELGLITSIQKQLEYTIINGTYAGRVDSTTARGVRGISSAISTISIDAISSSLSKAMIKSLWKSYADQNGVFGQNMVLWCNSFQKQALNEIYGLAERSTNIGGVNLSTLTSDFGEVGVAYSPNIKTDELLLVDMSLVQVVGKQIPGKGIFFSEELARTGASFSGQIYGELGVDYGSESKHAKITGLATS